MSSWTGNPQSRTWITSLIVVGILLGFGAFNPVPGQGTNDRRSARTGGSPEELVQFYKTMLTLYLENFERIDRLRSMRASNASQEANDLASKIMEETKEKVDQLRENLRALSTDNVRASLLKSMRKILKMYPLYVEKIATNWEPNRDQVLKRRRLGDNQIIRQNPELASSSLLRRVFLGELVTSIHFVPELQGWFQKRIYNLLDWISTKKKDLYPLYIRLVSRVEKVMTSEEVEESKKKQVIKKAREEWRAYWQNVGEGRDWEEVRYTTNQLSSFFRNRGNRLPGYQSRYKTRVKRLQRRIGELQRLQIKRPFTNRRKRLTAILLLSKLFANQVRDLGGQQGEVVMNRVTSFVTEFMNRKPADYWSVEGEEELQNKKTEEIQRSSLEFNDLRVNLDLVRKQYRFPTDAIKKLSGRLEANFGKEGKKIAEKIRKLMQYVQDQHHLLTEGTDLLKSYHDKLSQTEFKGADEIATFEQTFRSENESTLQSMMERIDRIRETEKKLRNYTESMSGINPEKLAAAFLKKENETNQ